MLSQHKTEGESFLLMLQFKNFVKKAKFISTWHKYILHSAIYLKGQKGATTSWQGHEGENESIPPLEAPGRVSVELSADPK